MVEALCLCRHCHEAFCPPSYFTCSCCCRCLCIRFILLHQMWPSTVVWTGVFVTLCMCVCVSERRDASRLKQSASAPHHPTFANIYAPNLPSYLAKNGEEKRPASRRDDDDAVRCTASWWSLLASIQQKEVCAAFKQTKTEFAHNTNEKYIYEYLPKNDIYISTKAAPERRPANRVYVFICV